MINNYRVYFLHCRRLDKLSDPNRSDRIKDVDSSELIRNRIYRILPCNKFNLISCDSQFSKIVLMIFMFTVIF